MKVISKPFKQIDREYIISSAELRKSLKLDGEIIAIGLHKGRSPYDVKKGKSAETELWSIVTKETQKVG